ncbi:major facilitator superfamily domain-containing protein [Xylogone sp. PMI_703]|nr:major facilitator superfamily domain-containing protein [Xylogone sp. PMI_703]
MADKIDQSFIEEEFSEIHRSGVKHESPQFDLSLEKKVLMKTDLNLIPILFLLFPCAFVNRINIGNARIQGLEKDLNMKGQDYNLALSIFFVLYILLEVPYNLLLRKVRPSTPMSATMIGWGVVTVCQGVTQSFAGSVVCRVLIGAFESGFFPSCIYLMSMYYRRHELQWRFNLFFSASVIAGAFSGLLAYAIAHMDGVAGYHGWRWIFILEGIFTVLVAIVSYWIIPDWPETARFLKEDERELLVYRLRHIWTTGTVKLQSVFLGMSRSIWGKTNSFTPFTSSAAMYLGIVTTSYSGAFFTPTVLQQLGWTSVRAQIMSIPTFVVAAICALSSAMLSDKLKHRLAFIIGGCLLATIGYVILLNMHHVKVGVRYFALYAIVAGGYIAQPIALIWLSNNVAGHYKIAIAPAMQVGLGNCGGTIASNVFIESQAPTYPLGFGLGLGLVWLCACSATMFLFYIHRENRLRDEGKQDERYNLPEDEQNNLGDDHPSFRFTY